MKSITNVPNFRLIQYVDSHNLRNIASMKRKIAYSSNTVTVANIALNEMDSYADTCCLEKNFIPVYYNGEVCNVHAYSDNIAPMKDVQIGAGATVWTDVGKTLTGYKKGRPLPVLPRMGRPPSSAPQNQTSTSTWNPTSYT